MATAMNDTMANATSTSTLPFSFGSANFFGLGSLLLPLLNNTWFTDSFRLLLLGSVVETGRRLWQFSLDKAQGGLLVSGLFNQGDLTYDWIDDYLGTDDFEDWSTSRIFRIRAIFGRFKLGGKVSSAALARAKFEPSSEAVQLYRWQKKYWVQVQRKPGTMPYYGTSETGGTITVTIYSRSKEALERLLETARAYYTQSAQPRVTSYKAQNHSSGPFLTALFTQGDLAHDWLMQFLSSRKIWSDARDLSVTAKSGAGRWGVDTDDGQKHFRYRPAAESPQMFVWNDCWIQATRAPGSMWRNKEEGGSIHLVLHTFNRQILDDLVETARQEYEESAKSRVVVHTAEDYGDWRESTTKARRPPESLILPAGTTEMIIADAKDFLESEDWYAQAGIPHRRGYLLWGPPGTGKSSTVHSIAGELSLEIYAISLSSKGLDDSNLQRAILQTPDHCILLLEDIDCAFPPRAAAEISEPSEPVEDTKAKEKEKEQERTEKKMEKLLTTQQTADQIDADDADDVAAGEELPDGRTRSLVTLSGLLNIIDGVSSQEGRLLFCTTNHIESLDPALIRPGRIDVKIQYKLASKAQIEDLFKRFYPSSGPRAQMHAASTMPSSSSSNPTSDTSADDNTIAVTASAPTPAEEATLAAKIAGLAAQFASFVPEDMFSIAALQGFLLPRKRDPVRAVEEVSGWLEEVRKEAAEIAKRERRGKKGLTRKATLTTVVEGEETEGKEEGKEGEGEREQGKMTPDVDGEAGPSASPAAAD